MRTLAAARSQVNLISSRKREHSRKPEESYALIERCSPGPYLELFAREKVKGWTGWGDELDSYQATRRIFPGYRGDVEGSETSCATADVQQSPARSHAR